MTHRLNEILTKEQQKVLEYRIDDISINEILQQAIISGDIFLHEDGTIRLVPTEKKVRNFHTISGFIDRKPCPFLSFVYRVVYKQAIVPNGCKNCFKVKVVLRTMRELVAIRELAKEIGSLSKWGTDVDSKYNQCLYGGYFYTLGLDDAKKRFTQVRTLIDEHPLLGTEIPMMIKRGCTHYEMRIGPSDQWEFDSALEPVEEVLYQLFSKQKRTKAQKLIDKQETFLNWLATAFRIGDNTYLDFTDGKRLYPTVVTYHEILPSKSDC